MGFLRDLSGWISGRDQRDFIASLNDLKRQVFAVPLEEAKEQVLRYLSDPTRCRCISASSELTLPSSVAGLPPLVAEFFTQYDSVEQLAGETRLSRRSIGNSAIDKRFIRVGTDHGDHFEIGVQPNAEYVYSIDGLEQKMGDGSIDRYPTLYHHLLFNERYDESIA